MSDRSPDKPSLHSTVPVSNPKRSRNVTIAASLAIAGILARYMNEDDHHANLPRISVSPADNATTEHSTRSDVRAVASPVPNYEDSPLPLDTNLSIVNANDTEQSAQAELVDPVGGAIDTGSAIFDDLVASGGYPQYFGQWQNFWGYIRGECLRRGVSESLVEHCVSGAQNAIADEKSAHTDRAQQALASGNQSEANRESRVATQLEALRSPADAFAEAMARGDVSLAMNIYRSAPAVDLAGHERIAMLVPSFGFAELENGSTTVNNTLFQIWGYLEEADKTAIMHQIRYNTDRLFDDNPMLTSDTRNYMRDVAGRWNSLVHHWFPGQSLEPAPMSDEDEES